MDGIAQVYDTNAAHPPATEEMRDGVRAELPGRSVLVGRVTVHAYRAPPGGTV